MVCSQCGQLTLSEGVCVDCSNKRFDDYLKLKEISEDYENMKQAIQEYKLQLVHSCRDHTFLRISNILKDLERIVPEPYHKYSTYQMELSEKNHRLQQENIKLTKGIEAFVKWVYSTEWNPLSTKTKLAEFLNSEKPLLTEVEQ